MSEIRLLVENKMLVSKTEEKCCLYMRSGSLGVWGLKCRDPGIPNTGIRVIFSGIQMPVLIQKYWFFSTN